jgi:uncharacterized protein YcbX
MIKIKDLFVYPIKSCKGIRVNEIELSQTGFLGDRNWMLVDEAGVFVSQREHPKLALVEPRLTEENLILNAPGMTELVVSRKAQAMQSCEVELFGEKMPSLFAGDEPSKWFGEYLGGNFQFVSRDPSFLRKGGVQYPARDEAPTSFVDNYGILVISEASRSDLNNRLVSGVPMNRFRPNIVVEGVDAYGEDYFASARAGDVTLRFVDVCYRCNMTTIDQEQAEFGQEPLQTLGRYRNSKAGVRFGSYAAVAGGVGKRLTAGSPLEIALNF